MQQKSDIKSFESFIRDHTSESHTVIVKSGDEILKDRIGMEDVTHSLACSTLINDQRYINKYFESINNLLGPSGVFIGKVFLHEHRKKKIYSDFPKPLSHFVYFLFCVLHRLFPKLPYIKKMYFMLTKGRFRSISKIEVIGRLCSCGFRQEIIHDTGSEFWFKFEKIGPPKYDTQATYGPLIKLKRRGLNNILFVVFKFRTMYPYSEYLQGYVYSNNGLDTGGKFKNDPRITSIGKFFRKYWIDELPMFWNLLKGEMKLVGPRPLSSHYFSLYPKDLQVLRGKVRPGLLPPFYADLPQTFEEICNSEEKYILEYLKSPIKTDLKYIWRIFLNIVVFRARSN